MIHVNWCVCVCVSRYSVVYSSIVYVNSVEEEKKKHSQSLSILAIFCFFVFGVLVAFGRNFGRSKSYRSNTHQSEWVVSCAFEASILLNYTFDLALGEIDRKKTAAKMIAMINRILDWFKSLFWKEEMELTLVGLQYSGKTTFVNVIAVSIFFLCFVFVRDCTQHVRCVCALISYICWVKPTRMWLMGDWYCTRQPWSIDHLTEWVECMMHDVVLCSLMA